MKYYYKSYAKVNLGLNIISKRKDNYHNIETIFHKINLYDDITFIESDSFSINCNKDFIPVDESNLIYKVKVLFEKYYNIKINFQIDLNKNIPVFAGLGGGSSNAACAMNFFNDFYKLRISQTDLINLSLKIGSDISFFLQDKTCYAESRGEILYPLNDFRLQKYIIVIFPKIKISTAEAYNNITPSLPEYRLKNIKTEEDFLANSHLIKNDFENYVFSKWEELNYVKDYLVKSGAIYSSLSGSGSSIYGIFEDKPDIENIKFIFHNYEVYLC